MSRWFYRKDGRPQGPVPAEEIGELVARGLLRPAAWVWPEGGDAGGGMEARAALAEPRVAAEAPPLPDWLADVARLETRGPVPPPAAAESPPDWLEDLRLWYGLGEVTAPSPPEQLGPPAAPQATPGAAGEGAPAVAVAGPATAEALRETGFDPHTGRITDPEQFEKWRQEPAAAGGAAGAPTNASLLEAFRDARVAVANWVDDESRRDLILRGDVEEILRHPELGALLRPFAGCGPVLREKVLRHAAFLVENRRKYYAARSE
jgi:hypothetical protein